MTEFNCYLLASLLAFLFSIFLWRYYNNGGRPMHSFIKRLSLAFALLLFVSAIVFVNLAFAKNMKDSLLDIFNNVFCTFVGVFAVFAYKNNLFK